MWRGKMSFRRLGVLIRFLPQESAFRTAVRDAKSESEIDAVVGAAVEPDPMARREYGPWSQGDMLLAAVVDSINALRYMQSDGKGPKPDPVPRPGVEQAVVTPINAEAKAFLDYIREHQGASPPEGWVPDLGTGTD